LGSNLACLAFRFSFSAAFSAFPSARFLLRLACTLPLLLAWFLLNKIAHGFRGFKLINKGSLCLGGLLSLEVGNREPSAVLQRGVLHGDELPTFLAQAVKVILNVINHGFDGPIRAFRVNSRFDWDDSIFPLGCFGHVTVRLGLEFRR
jgi:hypothetical protein